MTNNLTLLVKIKPPSASEIDSSLGKLQSLQYETEKKTLLTYSEEGASGSPFADLVDLPIQKKTTTHTQGEGI